MVGAAVWIVLGLYFAFSDVMYCFAAATTGHPLVAVLFSISSLFWAWIVTREFSVFNTKRKSR